MAIRYFLFAPIILSCFSSYGQSRNTRAILGEQSAKMELEESLADKKIRNIVDNKREIISDSTTAICIAEKILFKIYGQENIESQRPYETYKIKSYWVISGTLPRGMLGGTFLVIMDARDGRIIRISHGK